MVLPVILVMMTLLELHAEALRKASFGLVSDFQFVDDIERDGFAVIRGFETADSTDSMRAAMAGLIEEWDPETSKHSVFHVNMEDAGGEALERIEIESADVDPALMRDKYFFESADRISFFLEPRAIDRATGDVRTDLPKGQLLNKVGHGLHIHVPVFREYAQSTRVAEVARALGYLSPVMPQSMYIFKQPLIGEEVGTHQDATFLNTEPELSCLGLLLFLEDADLGNGCLWARKGSHKERLRKRWERNPAWFDAVQNNASTSGIDAMTFVVLDDSSPPPVEALIAAGKLKNDPGCVRTPSVTCDPETELRRAGYTPLPVRKGDLVLVGFHCWPMLGLPRCPYLIFNGIFSMAIVRYMATWITCRFRTPHREVGTPFSSI
jgi:phytanoyl-CoA hydroxylase